MSHYKPYPAYKDSGVAWLEQVPEHWQIKQLKYLASHIGSGKTPSGGAEVYQDAGVLFLRSQNVYEDGLRLDDAAFISDEVDEEMKGSRVRPCDVLLNITGASIGRSCLVPEIFQRANVNQHVCIIRGEAPVISKWISLCLPSKAVQAQIDFSQNGAGREGLNFEQIGNMLVALPPAEEVDEIAGSLDRETARIDALVAKKTRFIELLREKRQALITHAVTKGLDPNVKMKDSGVEWLGEVPEHWSIRSFKHLAGIRYGIGEPPAYKPEGTPLIRATNVDAGCISSDGLVYVDPADIPDKRIVWLTPGDIIVVRSGAYTGDSAIIREHHCPAIAGFDMVVSSKGVSPYYLQYALLSRYLKSNQIDLEKMRAAQPHLNAEELGSCFVLLPPPIEQESIIEFLDHSTKRVDGIISKTLLSIDLLKERRSALITAAVTGQIVVVY